MTDDRKRKTGGEVEPADALKLLIAGYWNLAYDEGKHGRTHDTPAGDAQRTWHQIEALIDDQSRALAERRAEVERLRDHVEQLSGERFSERNHVALQSLAKTAEARAERMAGALREACDLLEPDYPFAAWELRAALSLEPNP